MTTTEPTAALPGSSTGAGGSDSYGGDDTAAPPTRLLSGSCKLNGTELSPPFRFWIDEALWSQGRPAVQLVEEVLETDGGQRTGGSDQATPAHIRDGTALGWSQPGLWEVLWTKSTFALRAVAALRPGQLVSVVVGLNSLTMKKRLLLTLQAAYGAAAASQLTPLSFALPEQLDEWRAHVQQAGVPTTLWMLKTGQDAGKGLRLLPALDALRVAHEEASAPPSTTRHPLQVAQLYMPAPLLLGGRKFHLRLWVVVTQHQPLAAYLHRRGLALFSSDDYDLAAPWQPGSPPSSAAVQHGCAIAAGHITNLARNSSGRVWDLGQLAAALGSEAFDRVWAAAQRVLRLSLAAAHAPLQEAHAWLKPPFQDYGFQLLGADFLVDDKLRPWLLEFNSSPSIMALVCGCISHRHDDPAIAALIRREKRVMLADMWGLVRHRVWRHMPDSRAGRPGEKRCAQPLLGEFVDLFAQPGIG